MPLFTAASDDRFNFVSCFARNSRKDFAEYAKGYRFAANTIAESLMKAGRFEDFKAYPIMFLFRHSFELSLKNLIYGIPTLVVLRDSKDAVDKLYNDHNLQRLSDVVRSLLQMAFPQDADIKSISSVIATTALELSSIDKDSFAFRYPIDLFGKPATRHHLVVNLKSVYDHMNGILDDLERIDFGLAVETDRAQGMHDLLESAWPSATGAS